MTDIPFHAKRKAPLHSGASALLVPLCLVLIFQLSPSRCADAPLTTEALILPSRSVSLSLPAEAILREIRVKEGDMVKKGDVLAILYSPVELMEHERALKQRDLSEFKLRSSEKLRANAIVSEEAARQTHLDCDIARIEARRSEAVLADKTLKAPFDGYVLRILKEEGETVGRVDKIMTLVEFATLHVECYLESDLLGSIHKGRKAVVSIMRPLEQELEATVDMVDPVVDASSGLFRVRLVLPNPSMKIPSGISAKVRFADGNPVTAAPSTSASK